MGETRDEDRVTKIEDETVFAKENPEEECDCKEKANDVLHRINHQTQFYIICRKCGEIWRREKREE